MHKQHLLLCSVAFLALTACQPLNGSGPSPVYRTGITEVAPDQDAGVVIAESKLHADVKAKDTDLVWSDCKEGRGFGIEVDTTSGKEMRIYDRNGRPCPKADVMFDGKTEKDSRSAELGLKIEFHDPYQIEILKQVNNKAKLNDGITYSGGGGILLGDPLTDLDEDDLSIAEHMPPEIAAQARQMREAGVPEDQIKQTWSEYEDYSKSLKEKELALAKARQLSRRRTAQLLEQQDAVIADLGRQLRVAQERGESVDLNNKTLIEDLAQVEAEKYNKELQAQAFYKDMEKLKLLLKQNEMKALELEQRRKDLEEEYSGQIAHLEADLAKAQTEAKIARDAAALQAAQQIAEAQRLAAASKIAQRQALEKEAARLQRQAEEIARRASSLPQDIPTGDTAEQTTKAYAELMSGMPGDKEHVYRIQRLLSGGSGDPEALKKTTVAAHVENKALSDIMSGLLKDIAPKVGTWKVSWQLSDSFAFIPTEKWTVAVESDFGEFLEFVVNRVRQTHGVRLTIEIFEQNRLIVISDGQEQ